MRKTFAILMMLGWSGSAAVAGPLALDFVFVETGGAPVIADGFDGAALDPLWTSFGGPVPVAGSFAFLPGDSSLLAAVGTVPATATIATAVFDVSQVLPGESTTMLFGGTVAGDIVGVRFESGFASLFDETATLGAIAVDPASVVTLRLAVLGDGNVVGVANDVPIFAGLNEFGSPGALSINFVPEPVTLAFLGVGAVACALRRRR